MFHPLGPGATMVCVSRTYSRGRDDKDGWDGFCGYLVRYGCLCLYGLFRNSFCLLGGFGCFCLMIFCLMMVVFWFVGAWFCFLMHVDNLYCCFLLLLSNK